ncbi:MAG: superoxide dismutase family protein [Lachnospiraceae bacterium]|nr:superoxide dismutase family protein [Ruminococcus sp.]MCM1274989.1 superoxide dismutase family protein [Lachnospiraceae bacterium]
MRANDNVTEFSFMSGERPVLEAEILGGAEYPDIKGAAYVYFLPDGIYLQADFDKLPENNEFGFHVHEGLLCENPDEKLLPLPNVVSDKNGKSSMQIYLDRAVSTRIAGKPIVLHIKRGVEEITVACGILDRVL